VPKKQQRPGALGADPLDALLGTQGSPAQPERSGKPSSQELTSIRIYVGVRNQARDAVHFLRSHGFTTMGMTRFLAEAITEKVERVKAQYNNGEDLPHVDEALAPGPPPR
jgi:hypothetical protein